MNKIEVSESALESLKAMAQKLQEERDMLLSELMFILDWAHQEKCALREQEMNSIARAIAACQESTKVPE